ncbi:ATP-binding protein [Candidatus Halobeggiatoa sp. HSG11]|nr:ATP-binding protein [Candidatus Halobeggiatoa sp. HSG11]
MHHKLLQRQIKKFLRKSPETSPAIEKLFKAVSDSYEHYDKDRSLLEHSLELSSKELYIANQKIKNALQQTKGQLVQSEKMAVLGQLIAGIAHEINTPAGAIKSAIGEVEEDYLKVLEQVINLLETLTPEARMLYIKATKAVFTTDKNISTKERRKVARKITRTLDEHDIEDANEVGKDLALIGLSPPDVDELIPLLKTTNIDEIQQSLRQFGTSQIHVRDIKIAIDRIAKIVKALKHYSHIDDSNLTFTSLQEDLDNTLIILHNQIKHGVIVYKEYDEIPPFRCYADLLNQVWTNLIYNSVQAMNAQGEIFVRLKKIDDEVIVEIEDNGPGISEDVQHKIFESNFTTKSKGEGTGLGLSICQELIQKHQGKIEVESQPGRTCFKVVLPFDPKYLDAIS